MSRLRGRSPNYPIDAVVSSSSSNEMDDRLRHTRMYLPQYSEFYGSPIWSRNPIQSNLAATQIQKNIRGNLTRSRFSKYKDWKGTKAFDQIMYEDEDIYDYLLQDKNNFIVQLTNNNNYEAFNLDDLFSFFKINELQEYFGIQAYNVFYECKNNNKSLNPKNINKDVEYIKFGSSNFVVLKPDWFVQNTIIPEPRIFKLVKHKIVNALASIKVLDYLNDFNFISELKVQEEAERLGVPIDQVDFEQFGIFLSADFCNHTHPIQTYKLELLTESNMVTNYLETLAEYELSSDSPLNTNLPQETILPQEIKIGSIVEWKDKNGKNMKGKVIQYTSKKDKCRICCKPGKKMGDKDANYLVDISKLKLLQQGSGKNKLKKNTKKKSK